MGTRWVIKTALFLPRIYQSPWPLVDSRVVDRLFLKIFQNYLKIEIFWAHALLDRYPVARSCPVNTPGTDQNWSRADHFLSTFSYGCLLPEWKCINGLISHLNRSDFGSIKWNYFTAGILGDIELDGYVSGRWLLKAETLNRLPKLGKPKDI